MLSRAMRSLTGKESVEEAWKRFFQADDVVGIKLNCSGAPAVCSTPEVVAEIVRNLVGVGVKPANIYLYERFENQIADSSVCPISSGGSEYPRGRAQARGQRRLRPVHICGSEFLWRRRYTVEPGAAGFRAFDEDRQRAEHEGSWRGRSYRLSQEYRVRQFLECRAFPSLIEKTNTLTFIGTLAAIEPLRSKTVLHVMDGLTGVWHGGPFVLDKRFVFHPKQILVGTDPVAIDRQLLDVIEEKRREERAPFGMGPIAGARAGEASAAIRISIASYGNRDTSSMLPGWDLACTTRTRFDAPGLRLHDRVASDGSCQVCYGTRAPPPRRT